MILTWKDVATTALAVTTGALALAKYQGWQSFATGSRLGVVVLGLIGIAMCALSTPIGSTPLWNGILSALGIVALVLIIIGVSTGNRYMFFALAADIIVLWL